MDEVSVVAGLRDGSLTAIELQGPDIDWTLIAEALSNSQCTITRLHLSQTKVDALLPVLPTTLEDVSFDDCRISSTSIRPVLQALSECRLTRLCLSNNPLGPRGAKLLASSLAGMPLTELHLSGVGLGHFGAQALGGGALPLTLVRLDLSSNKMLNDGVWKLAGGLALLTHLAWLSLADNAMADDGCLEMAHRLADLPALQVLDVSGNDIGNVGVEGLAASLLALVSAADDMMGPVETVSPPSPKATPGSQLRQLNLSKNNISDVGAEHLARALAKTSSLTSLNMSHNQIADAGAQALADALLDQNHDGLEELDLSFNQIGDIGAGAFVEHLDHLALTKLVLDGNDISAARMRILDMLLKHRTPRKKTLDTLSGHESSASRLRVDEAAGDEPSASEHVSEHAIDEEAVEEGREALLHYVEHGPSGDGVLTLPAGYLYAMTTGFDRRKISSYGAFGPLYSMDDEELDDDVDLVVRRVELGPAGPLQMVRDTVLKEIAAFESNHFAALVATSLDSRGAMFVYNRGHRQTLRDLMSSLESRKALSWKTRVSILRSTALALVALHSPSTGSSSFHGDLSSSSVYVDEDYSVELLDAGLSRLLATDRRRFASGEVVFGCRSYRCPRYERGSASYDTASDMFAFGVILAEVFMGRLQRSRTNNTALAFDVFYDVVMSGQKQLATDPGASAPPTAPVMEALVQIMLSCLSPVPMQRPTATTVADILGQLPFDG